MYQYPILCKAAPAIIFSIAPQVHARAENVRAALTSACVCVLRVVDGPGKQYINKLIIVLACVR